MAIPLSAFLMPTSSQVGIVMPFGRVAGILNTARLSRYSTFGLLPEKLEMTMPSNFAGRGRGFGSFFIMRLQPLQ